MTARGADLRKRAERFLRWYPREWRDRYGEEFVEFLVADLEEQSRSIGRTVDVARSGLLARLAASGLAGRSLDTAEQSRRSLAAFGCAVSLFLTAALAIWAQLTIGWQWSSPDTVATVRSGKLSRRSTSRAFVAHASGFIPPAFVTILNRGCFFRTGPRRSSTSMKSVAKPVAGSRSFCKARIDIVSSAR